MPQIINTNVSSLNAQRNLNSSQSAGATAMQRLSSGLRINSAKDDAAGLAIADRFTAQIRGTNQAARNANDAISLTQIADGALGSVSDNLQRLRELAVQSANATNTATDRAALQIEVAQLKSEIDRISNQTNFNGTKLLDGSFTSATFQVGANAGETISVSGLQNSTIAALGSVTSASTQSTVVSGLGTGAVAAGSLTINGTDIGALAAVGTSQERAAQVVDAINKIATTTGVNAYVDSTTSKIVMTSNATITLAGTDNGALTGFDGATGVTAASATTTGLTTLDVSSFAGASNAITAIDSALKQVNSSRANLGALQSRFSATVANLQTTSENLSASRSRIQDTDYAAETAALTRAQILQQAGMAMLAQANQQPNQVMTLLKG